MPTALTGIVVDEISLVDRPANRKRFALRKAEDDMPADQDDIIAQCLEVPLENEAAIDEAIQKAGMDRRPGKAAKLIVRLLHVFRDEFQPEHVPMLSALAGYATRNAEPEPDDGPAGTTKSDTSPKEAAVPDDAKTAEIQKSLDEQKEAITKMSAENAELRKALDAERDERVLRECVAKASAEYPLLGGKEDVGAALKDLAKAGLLTKVEPLLKAAQEKAKAGEALFRQQGRGSRGSVGNSALQQLQAKADEIQKSMPALSAAAAYEKALERNPDLYEQSRREA